jgi:hypothetical protein
MAAVERVRSHEPCAAASPDLDPTRDTPGDDEGTLPVWSTRLL